MVTKPKKLRSVRISDRDYELLKEFGGLSRIINVILVVIKKANGIVDVHRIFQKHR